LFLTTACGGLEDPGYAPMNVSIVTALIAAWVPILGLFITNALERRIPLSESVIIAQLTAPWRRLRNDTPKA
jgi:hypothetical protein